MKPDVRDQRSEQAVAFSRVCSRDVHAITITSAVRRRSMKRHRQATSVLRRRLADKRPRLSSQPFVRTRTPRSSGENYGGSEIGALYRAREPNREKLIWLLDVPAFLRAKLLVPFSAWTTVLSLAGRKVLLGSRGHVGW